MSADLATPALAKLHAWHDQQNPLVRALTVQMVELFTDTVTQMQAVIGAQAAEIPEIRAEAESLREATKVMQAEHAMALTVTTDRLDVLERRLFGRRSERGPKMPDARNEANKKRRSEMTDEQKAAQRQAAAKARQAILDALRSKVVVISVDPETPAGRPLPPLDSVLFEWRRGELVRLLIRREQRVLPDGGGIVTAPPPPQVVEGGTYGPALHAHVAVEKCVDAMPLRRQERAFERIGAPLPVSVLCGMFHRCAVLVEPVYKAIMARVGTAEHVSADETPQPVLDDEQVRRGWMWIFATDEALLYVYSPSRGGSVPEKVIGNSKGTLTVDGHTGYNLVTREGGRERGGCWSHGRRGLYDARAYAETVIDGLLTQIRELYYIEHIAIEQQIVGTPEHLALRTERSAPVVRAIFEVIEKYVGVFDARSSIAKAMRYLLNQREPLSLFLKDPRVPIHNNLSERALRIVALLRKNALFVGNDESGTHLAMLLTMTATCQLHGVDPEKWLADTLIRMTERGSTIEELLPWNWKHGRGTTFKPAFDTS